ncbi:MAG: hypothetical protein RJQ04_21975 [Longimicrobiales bacterium]
MATGERVRRGQVLSDSEATLRQVQDVLADFGDQEPLSAVDRVLSDLEERPTGLRELVRILVKTYSEIVEVIDSLRKSRGLLEQAAMQRLKSTHAKLAEVSSATEMAATGMLDGLDRALVLVDHLEAASPDDDGKDGVALRGELRDELHQLIGLLQFQDITSQQLGYASGVLQDIEERMVRLSEAFDLRGMGIDELIDVSDSSAESDPAAHPTGPSDGKPVTCDPGASTMNADSRQALADSIFR